MIVVPSSPEASSADAAGETGDASADDKKDDDKKASEKEDVGKGGKKEEDTSKFAGIPKELLHCMACDKSMWNGMVNTIRMVLEQMVLNTTFSSFPP